VSYCRWGEDGSSVYVFGVGTGETDADDYLVCMGCVAQVEEGDEFRGSFTCKTPAEMLSHLLAHRERGDVVPESAIERLREEMNE